MAHDRSDGTSDLISADINGVPADGLAGLPTFAGDGRSVGFVTPASNLVGDDTNGAPDVFLKVYPVPRPVAASPNLLRTADGITVDLTGSHFRAPVVVGTLGATGVTITGATVIDEHTIEVDIEVAPDAPAGPVTLTVKNVSFGIGATGYCGTA